MSRYPHYANPTPSFGFLRDEEREEEVVQFYGQVLTYAVPLATGIAFVAAPYIAGAAIVAFAPPWLKPVGVAMLVPNPVDVAYFTAGVAAGVWFVENHPLFDWIDD